MRNPFLILAFLALLLSGCVVGTVAKTAVDVVTIPVKVGIGGRRRSYHQPERGRRKART